MLDSMRVALVHDWLTGMRGGERVLHQLALCYPEADLYTLLHVPGATSRAIDELSIHTSPLHRIPGAARHYRKLLPLFPWAIERFRLDDYDLVISTSHAVAKSVPTGPGTVHLDYCLTPMRYVWDMSHHYFNEQVSGRATRWFVPFFLNYLRVWDYYSSARVNRFVSISRHIEHRIRKHYRRGADVIYPPVESDRFQLGDWDGGYYLIVSAFAPYKRIDLAVEACNRLGRRLVVVGRGPEQHRLARLAGPTVELVGWQSDTAIRGLLRRARALLFPGNEDFGIVPVESQACGTPVAAFAQGGATETVLEAGATQPGTGLLFGEQTPEALVDAIRRIEAHPEWFPAELARRNAEPFSTKRFERELVGYLDEVAGPSAHVK